MNRNELKEILRYFPKYRTRFDYFKDRYALLLLQLAFADGARKQDIKASSFAQLLDKAVVKELLSMFGGKAVTADDYDWFWPLDVQCYHLTLGTWDGSTCSWNQTSRQGFNLVLQLNFSNQHNAAYRRLVDPGNERPFEFFGHPISKRGHTLAWARLDIDLDRGEALIEEIQNDWLREARWAYREAVREGESCFFWSSDIKAGDVIRYVTDVLRDYETTWDEAMLSATLWFLRRELGITKVYYHTHETGAAMKRIFYRRQPPRSLYTRLPRKFCFEESGDAPAFIRRKSRSLVTRKKLSDARFHSLTL